MLALDAGKPLKFPLPQQENPLPVGPKPWAVWIGAMVLVWITGAMAALPIWLFVEATWNAWNPVWIMAVLGMGGLLANVFFLWLGFSRRPMAHAAQRMLMLLGLATWILVTAHGWASLQAVEAWCVERGGEFDTVQMPAVEPDPATRLTDYADIEEKLRDAYVSDGAFLWHYDKEKLAKIDPHRLEESALLQLRLARQLGADATFDSVRSRAEQTLQAIQKLWMLVDRGFRPDWDAFEREFLRQRQDSFLKRLACSQEARLPHDGWWFYSSSSLFSGVSPVRYHAQAELLHARFNDVMSNMGVSMYLVSGWEWRKPPKKAWPDPLWWYHTWLVPPTDCGLQYDDTSIRHGLLLCRIGRFHETHGRFPTTPAEVGWQDENLEYRLKDGTPLYISTIPVERIREQSEAIKSGREPGP
jgi:hypothetical protein